MTRPLFKRHVRSRHALLHAASRAAAALPLDARLAATAQLNQLWKAIAVVQHHDSITGTAKPVVFANYNLWLQWGATKAAGVLVEIASSAAPVNTSGRAQLAFGAGGVLCDERYDGAPNVLVCSALAEVTKGNVFVLRAFNPLAWGTNTSVELELPSATSDYTLTNAQGEPLTTQRNGDRFSFALSLPPLGSATLYLDRQQERLPRTEAAPVDAAAADAPVLENAFLRLTFDGHGDLKSIKDKRRGGVDTAVSCQVGWFNSSGDMFAWSTDARFHGLTADAAPLIDFVNGAVYAQLTTTRSGGNITVSYRLPATSQHIEVTLTVTPGARLPPSFGQGGMLALRLATELKTTNSAGRNVFFTDSNGMGLLRRATTPKPAAGRFHGGQAFPAVGYSQINDSSSALFAVNDRAQGVQSVAEGALDILVFDSFDIDADCGGAGCGHGLKTRAPSNVSTTLRLGVGTPDSARAQARRLATAARHPPLVLAAVATSAALEQRHAERSAEASSDEAACPALPSNVHLMTLQPFAGGARFAEPAAGVPCAIETAAGTIDLSSLDATEISVSRPVLPVRGRAATAKDVYRVGWCNMIRCPTPGELFNFGYALRTVHQGVPNCIKAWPGPLAPTPLRPRVSADGATVVLRPQAVTDDGILAPRVTGHMEVVLHCDERGAPGVATPLNASLIQPGAATPQDARYVAKRLEFTSKCACPGGCSQQRGGAQSGRSAAEPASPLAANATMPADGAFIVRLQHLYGSAEGLGPLSQPVTVDLQSIFCAASRTVVQVVEMSITANQRIEDVHHHKWRTTDGATAQRLAAEDKHSSIIDGTVVIVPPLATKTYVVTVKSDDDAGEGFLRSAAESTPAMQIGAAQAMARRLLGKQHAAGFTFELLTKNERCVPGDAAKTCFELAPSASSASSGGVALVRGSTGVELTAGLGHYLRHVANISISWPGTGGSSFCGVAGELPPLTTSSAAVKRYVRSAKWLNTWNVCTFSYSFVWWDFDRWQHEIE